MNEFVAYMIWLASGMVGPPPSSPPPTTMSDGTTVSTQGGGIPVPTQPPAQNNTGQ